MRSTKLALLASLANYSKQEEMTAEVDTTRPLVLMKDYVPPNDLDNDPNYYYPTHYRILNCWECFEAQGKVCMDQGHNSLFHHTGSSDPGALFCCKPDSKDGYCNSGATHNHEGEGGITTVCSQPSYGATSEYQSILTGNRNHQLFAFCPSINHQKCGVQGTTSSSTDMALKAGVNKQHVETTEMRYRKPSIADPTREYDSCYYEITLDQAVLADYTPKKLHLQITGKSSMNVYIYGGKNRHEAKQSLIQGNAQASVGQTYSIGVETGFLVVAYPFEGAQDTDLGFNYWVEAVAKTDDSSSTEGDSTGVEIKNNENVNEQLVIGEPEQNPDTSTDTVEVKYTQKQTTSELDEMLFYGLCAGAAVLFLAIVAICCKCRKQKKITTSASQDLGYPSVSGNNSNERSLHIESMGDDETEGNRDQKEADSSKGQAMMQKGTFE